jgi:neutral amino acid transport system permease protein
MNLVLADFANLALNGLAEGLLIALPALAVTLVFGIVRFANAATGDLVTVGGFGAFSAYKASGGSFLVAAAGGLSAGLFAGWASWLLVFKPVSRQSGVTLLLTSIGLGFLLRSLLGLTFGNEHNMFELPMMRAWNFGPVSINPMDGIVAVMAVFTVAAVFLILHGTPMGLRMRAMADNHDLARVVGIPTARSNLTMWCLVGVVCGIAGLLVGLKTLVSPEAGAELLLPAFAAAVVGGLGNPIGAVAGAVLLGVFQELSTPFVGFTYKIALSYGAMLLVLLWRPQGMFNGVQGVR